MNKAIIIFTEGNDDIAFLSRVLKTQNFVKCQNKIKELISPLREIIKTHINDIYPLEYQKEESEDDILITEIRTSVPKIFLKINNGDKYYLVFYSIGGKSTIEERAVSIIEKYLPSIFTPDFNINENNASIEKYSFAFFFDADESKLKTIKDLQNSLKKVLDSESWEHNTLFNGKLKYREEEKDTKIICYIFPSEEQGALENIILPMMKSNVKDDRFVDAENFYKKFKAKKRNLTKKEKIAQNIKKVKAIIGIAGQLEKEARPNSALYEDGIYFKNQIAKNKQCNEIIELINSLFE